ncbi:MAG: response regulator [Acidobacteriota bacterium]
MDIQCLRCGATATPAGHEDAHAYFQCSKCARVWAASLLPPPVTEAQSGRSGAVRVLVVDDAEELVRLISIWLATAGYDVVTAGTGDQALEAASVHHPDIVLLDLVIPPPDGFAVCEALRHPFPPEIILMTGLSDPDHLRRALALGVVALLRKPLTRESVVDMVAIAAERCRRDPLAKLRTHFDLRPRP